MDIRLSARAAARALAFAIAAITLLHLAGQVLRWQFGSGYGLVRFFHTNQEGNFSAYFSALNMLLAAVLLMFCAAAERRSRTLRASWLFLALLFVFLPFDELFAVHERLNVPMRRVLGATGALAFAWVVPYALATLVAGALVLGLLRSLPRRTRIMMVAAGATFVGGALGMEMVGASLSQTRGMDSAAYVAATTVEELLEMSGVALFTVALMEHLANVGLAVRFAGSARAIAVEPPRVGRPAATATPVAGLGAAARSARPLQERPGAGHSAAPQGGPRLQRGG
jgi:hypothetical protein